MRVAVLQSNYIPWKGYFDLMAMSDLFVVYDSVQYTKNDWRNRNLVLTAAGPVWLTIPIATAGLPDQPINAATVNDPRWARKHWATISQSLRRRPYFAEFAEEWERCYERCAHHELLHDINVDFINTLARQLAITAPIVDDRAYDLGADTPSGKLVQICQQVGADRYVTGSAGLNYLEVERFHRKGIAIDVIEYDHYPTYSQSSEPFMHGVSVLDLLASVGDAAGDHLLGRYRTIEVSEAPRP
jgi:hypothetical protein